MKYFRTLFFLLSICHVVHARNFTEHTVPLGYVTGNESDPFFRPLWRNECVTKNRGEECHYKIGDFPIQYTQKYMIPLRMNTHWVAPLQKNQPLFEGAMYTGNIKGGRIILLWMSQKNHKDAKRWLDEAESRIISRYDENVYN